jgi:hypothetical protein
VGVPVETAADLEERSGGGRIAITGRVYQALPESLSEHFSYDSKAGGYVADGLTADMLDLATRAKDYKARKSALIAAAAAGALVVGAGTAAAKAKKKDKE